jgi:hypothetical protein
VGFVISANLRRRHLTPEKKRELIAKLLKTEPEASDRQIGASVAVDHKTVGSVRAELEGRGEIPHVETRTDSKGRKQPAAKRKAADGKARKQPAAKRKPLVEQQQQAPLQPSDDAATSAEARKAAYAAADTEPTFVSADPVDDEKPAEGRVTFTKVQLMELAAQILAIPGDFDSTIDIEVVGADLELYDTLSAAIDSLITARWRISKYPGVSEQLNARYQAERKQRAAEDKARRSRRAKQAAADRKAKRAAAEARKAA